MEYPTSALLETTVPLPLLPEDRARADLYSLIGHCFLAPPDYSLLEQLASAEPIVSQHRTHPLDLAWEKLAQAASVMDAAAVADEYSRLFIDAGMPQVNPYGSRYLAGFLMEKPLAALRNDLSRLGLGRMEGSGELEDHLGALCETMRVLITGEITGQRQPLEVQKTFFERHIDPWWQDCLNDLRQAAGANFYRCIADFAEAFLLIEREAFELAVPARDVNRALNE